MLQVLRDGEFVREFSWNNALFLDSKYRTCELPFRADYFLHCWSKKTTSEDRIDMIHALSEFPSAFANEERKIVRFLCGYDRAYAHQALQMMRQQRSEPSPEQVAWYLRIYQHVHALGKEAWRLVGENPWFAVSHSIAEMRIDEKSDCPALLGSAQLIELWNSESEGLYKWGIEMMCRSRGLLVPRGWQGPTNKT